MASIGMKFDPSSLNKGLDKLNAEINKEVRPAAQAGAQELYDEVKHNVSRLGRKTGNMYNSIYQVYSKDNSSDGVATYHVSWNAKKAPHGHLIENGTSRAPAYPFVRPAYDAKNKQALEATRDRMTEGVQKIINGLKS